MVGDSIGEWQELSRLYEHADTLRHGALSTWLEELRAARHPLLAKLERMLDARARVAGGDFLATLPRIDSAPDTSGSGWGEGSRVGAYRLVRHIGAGGMAEVWLAERCDGAFERQVAIKLLHTQPTRAQRASVVERFRRERDILASLDHPNIAALHDAGVTAEGQPWLALEYVEGEPITGWCDRRRLGIDDRVRTFTQVLEAVAYAHANLVIHRDLKPSNILVTEKGEVRLLDFGIAKLLDASQHAIETDLTREAGRPMTPQYASPEQFAGEPLTTASDIYSLAVVLYELLAGVLPYATRGATARSLEAAILESDIEVPSRRAFPASVLALRATDARHLRRALRPDLDAILLHCLRRQPRERYDSVGALHADIARWRASEPVLAAAPGSLYRLGKFVGRHRMGVSAGAAVAVALLSALTVSMVQSRRAQEEALRALASKDYVLNLFSISDPGQTRGAEISARELLDAGREQANRTLREQPLLRAEVLAGIARIDQRLGRYTTARRALSEVADIYAQLGRRREWASVQLELADNAMRSGDNRVARERLDAARPVLGELESDPRTLVRSHEVQGWLARTTGDLPQALLHMKGLLAASMSAYGSNDGRTAEALRGLAEVEAELRHHDLALQHLGRAREILRLAPNGTMEQQVDVDIDEARIEFDSGNLRRARPLLASAAERCDRELGSQYEDCFFVRGQQAQLLLQIGAYREASTLLPALLAESRNDGSPRRQAEASAFAARVMAANAMSVDPAVRSRLATLAAPRAQEAADFTRAAAKLALAEMALREGRLDQVEPALSDLFARSDDADAAEHAFLARAELLRGLALQAADNHAQALAALERSELSFRQAFGSGHTASLIYRLNRVPSLLASGRRDEAAALLGETVLELQRRLPPDAPVLAAARSIQGSLHMSQGDMPMAARRAVFLSPG